MAIEDRKEASINDRARNRFAAAVALFVAGGLLLPVAGSDPVPVGVELPRGPRTEVDNALEADDASFGGWETEVLSAEASGRLKQLGDWLASRGAGGAAPAELASEKFGCPPLRPPKLERVFDDGLISVDRGAASAQGELLRGAVGLRAALDGLIAGFGPDASIRVKFKVVSVDVEDDGFNTRVLYAAFGRSGRRGVQQNAAWVVGWRSTADGVRLVSVEPESFEEVVVRAAGGALFADYTLAALGATPSYARQMAPGTMHWVDRISQLEHASITGHQGIAVGDVNGDGLEDLYVCDDGGLPNRLYLHQPDGTLRDVSAMAGVDWLDHTFAALLVDLDNDGDADLAAATYPSLLLMENDGEGQFELRESLPVTEEAFGLAAADFDTDGDLDLYVVTYGSGGSSSVGLERDSGRKTRSPVPYHDANNGGANALLRNQGDFSFADVTAPAGLDVNNRRYSFAAAWEDYDDDGDPDLYVANDFGRNNLYRNDGGKFVDVAAAAGVEDIATGMSAAWGDFDRDGRMDIYVGNMYSSAGHRIAYQRQFLPGRPEEEIASLRHTAAGNTLFRNNGDGSFRDVSAETGVNVGRWAWASKFADLNNDGWEDLVVANGFLTGEIADDL